MLERRTRTILWTLLVVAVAWGLGVTGYRLGISSRMTAEKVAAFLNGHDLSQLSAADRAAALRALADQINALSPEERRRVREEQRWKDWVAQLTDAEKEALITATFPTGIKQIMTAFEQMSEAQRRRMVDEALKRLKDTGELRIGDRTFAQAADPSQEPRSAVSPQVVEKIREVGLRTFFSESSAQMKVEAAPLLEEIQRQMQSGGWGRHGQR